MNNKKIKVAQILFLVLLIIPTLIFLPEFFNDENKDLSWYVMSIFLVIMLVLLLYVFYSIVNPKKTFFLYKNVLPENKQFKVILIIAGIFLIIYFILL